MSSVVDAKELMSLSDSIRGVLPGNSKSVASLLSRDLGVLLTPGGGDTCQNNAVSFPCPRQRYAKTIL